MIISKIIIISICLFSVFAYCEEEIIDPDIFINYILEISSIRDSDLIIDVTERIIENIDNPYFRFDYWYIYYEHFGKIYGEEMANEKIKSISKKIDKISFMDLSYYVSNMDLPKDILDEINTIDFQLLPERTKYLAFVHYLHSSDQGKIDSLLKCILHNRKNDLGDYYYSSLILFIYSEHLRKNGNTEESIFYYKYLVDHYNKNDWFKEFFLNHFIEYLGEGFPKTKDDIKQYEEKYLKDFPNSYKSCLFCTLNTFSDSDLSFIDDIKSIFPTCFNYLRFNTKLQKIIFDKMDKLGNENISGEKERIIQMMGVLTKYDLEVFCIPYAEKYYLSTGDAETVCNFLFSTYNANDNYEKALYWSKVSAKLYENPIILYLAELRYFHSENDIQNFNLMGEKIYQLRLNKSNFKETLDFPGINKFKLTGIIDRWIIIWLFNNKKYSEIIDLLNFNTISTDNKNTIDFIEYVEGKKVSIYLNEDYKNIYSLWLLRSLYIEYIKNENKPRSEVLSIIKSDDFLSFISDSNMERLIDISKEKNLIHLNRKITSFCVKYPHSYYSKYMIEEIIRNYIDLYPRDKIDPDISIQKQSSDN